MQPLGNKILVRDIVETEEKKTEGGIFIDKEEWQKFYKKVKIEEISPDSKTVLKKDDVCFCTYGGVELEQGLWLCNENQLDCKI